MDPGELGILEQILLNEADQMVRQVAMSRIHNLDLLERIANNSPHASDRNLAMQHWANRLANNTDLTPLAAEKKVTECTNPMMLAAVVNTTENQNLQTLALVGIRDEKILLSLLHTKNSRIWPLVISRIDTENSLLEAQGIVKGRDKKSLHILKEKLLAIRESVTAERNRDEQAKLLHNKLEQLQRIPENPLFEGTLIAARQQYQELSLPVESLHCQQIAEAIQQCEEILAQRKERESEKQKEKEREIALQRQKEEEARLAAEQIAEEKADPAETARIEEEARQRKEQLRQLAEQVRIAKADFEKLVAEMDAHLANKELKKSRSLHQKIKNAIQNLPEIDQQELAPTTQRLWQALRELEDWKEFAVLPKFESLCNEMASLVDADIPPELKAKNIRQLQQDWKALGHCHHQDLWQKFRELGNTAFLPCQQYFDAQRELCAFNARQKETICTELENLLSRIEQESPDWKWLEKIHHTIGQEWQKYSPVENHDHKVLQDRYFQSLNRIKEKLNGEKEKNHKKLQLLIDKANRLLELNPVDEAIQQYRQLQQEWKNGGITHHQEQRQQWQAFQSAGDSLYNRKKKSAEAARNLEQEQKESADRLVAEMMQLAERAKEESFDGNARFHELCIAFEELTHTHKSVRTAFRTACQAYDNAQRLREQKTWVKDIASLEAFGRQLQAGDSATILQQIPEHFPERWKTGIRKAISSSQKQGNNEQQRELAQRLCIEMEMLGEKETPAEDASLKMKIQMEKLAEHFRTQSTRNKEEQLEELLLRWLALFSTGGKVPDELEKRFYAAANSNLLMTGLA